MSQSFVISLNRSRSKAAEGKIASSNKQESRKNHEMTIKKAVEGESKTSSATKGFAKKAYSLSLSAGALSRGPWYPKPQ
ncbi:hypothetical protein [Magnetococcus marinus]|uniref:hypothetical protein n=1 Tax=Magnetococcus marinus TaxID=1124597 RepID=UPI0005A00D18|nr:hypothetical protein [Magnetococcus marinus]